MGLRQPHVEGKDLPVEVVRPRGGGLSPFPNDDDLPLGEFGEGMEAYPKEVFEAVEVFY